MDKKILTELGFLDEDFFVYCEDLDFALRAKRKGYIPLVDTSIRAIHHIEMGKRSSFLFRYYHQYKGNLRIFLRHLKPHNILTASLFWTLGLSLVETLYLKVHPIYHLLKLNALIRNLSSVKEDILKRRKYKIYGSGLYPKPKVRKAFKAMFRHAKLRGHSW